MTEKNEKWFQKDFQNEYKANFIKAGNHKNNYLRFWKLPAHKQKQKHCRDFVRVPFKAIVSSDGLVWKCYQWIDDKFLLSPEQIFC